MHLRIANDIVSYHGLSGHQPRSQGFFPNAERLIGPFCSNQSLCVRKEALGTRLSGHSSLLSFQTQQEQTVLIW